MGKRTKQKPNVLRNAAQARAQYLKWLMLLIVGLVICIVAIAVYAYLSYAMILQNTGIAPWLTAVVAAAVVGYFGNKFSRSHRAYQEYLEQHGLTAEDVKEFKRNN